MCYMAFYSDYFKGDGDILEEMEFKYLLMRNGKENSMHRPLCHGRENTWERHFWQGGTSHTWRDRL